jgi:hypothetical protein
LVILRALLPPSPPVRPSKPVRRLDASEGLQVHVQGLEVTLSELMATVESLLNQMAAA